MPVNRSLWREQLTKRSVPNWHCPKCAGGYLKHKADALHAWETSESREAHQHEAWDPEWCDYRFAALLVCNNEKCQEPVVVAGTGKVELVQTFNHQDSEYVEFFYPTYINPSPSLIPLSAAYPPEVVGELERAFVSSWCDFSAAGNHIRAAVERLLDHLKEPKIKIAKSGKRERISLHLRIAGLAQRDQSLGDALLAVKWLGNAGSHTDELTQENVYDALDILESVLDDLFIKHQARLKKLVATINRKKGPAKGGSKV